MGIALTDLREFLLVRNLNEQYFALNITQFNFTCELASMMGALVLPMPSKKWLGIPKYRRLTYARLTYANKIFLSYLIIKMIKNQRNG